MKDKLIKALRDIIDDKGADFLLNNAKIACNILCDVIPEAENERKRLRIALTSDTMEMISNIGNATTDADQLINKAVRYLADETFWSEELARETVTILVGALYPDIAISGEAQISAPKPRNSASVITASPTTQPIDYEYDDDDYTRMWSLEFKPIKGNGYAVTRYSAFGKESIITIPSSYKGRPVIQIGDRAFENADIVEIIMPDSIIEIGKSAFAGCTISQIHLSKELKKIGDCAFMNTDLTECTIPDSVIEISFSAFAYCIKLKKIHLSSALQKIGSSAFNDTQINKLMLPSHLGEIDIKTINGINEIAFTSRNTVIKNVETVTNVFQSNIRPDLKLSSEYAYSEDRGMFGGVIYHECSKPNKKGEALEVYNPKWKFYCLPGSKAFDFAKEWGIPYRPLTEYKE